MVTRAICWFFILGIVALSVIGNVKRAKTPEEGRAADNSVATAIGRIIVATHAATPTTPKGNAADPIAPLITEMDMMAKAPMDRVSTAIISKEVQPADVADKRLTSLLASKDLPADAQKDLAILQQIYHAGANTLSDAQRQTLIDDQGWCAQVALAYGQPNTNPQRAAMLSQAQRTLLLSVAAGGLGAVLLVVAITLLVLAIVIGSLGKLRLLFARPLANTVFLESFAIYLVGFVLLSLVLHELITSPSLGWSMLLTIMLPIAVAWPVIRGKPWHQTRMELGWHRGQGIFWEIGCGIVGYITALPLLAIMLVITLQLIHFSNASPSHPIQNYLGGSPAELAMLYFIACIWAPVFEETMFRGALFNHLRGRHGWWISAGIVGLIFASIHPQGWTTIPILGGIGMVLCALREWRGSLIASMAAHALNNGTVLTLAILMSR
jgi:membrane protease YdiL (CAAX protease family)